MSVKTRRRITVAVLAFIAAVLAFAVPVEASFTHIATASGSGNQSGVTTGDIDTTASGGADLIVCSGAWYSGGGAGENPTFADSASNSWTKLTVRTAVTYSNALWYKISPTTNASHNFSLTGTDVYSSLQCSAFAAAGTVTFEAESAGGTTNPATSLQPGSLTPSGNDRLFVTGLTWHGNSETVSIDNSFTIGAQNDYHAGGGEAEGGAMAYRIQVAAGALNPTWSWTNNNFGAASMATFVDGAGGGGGSKNLTMLGVGVPR